MGVAVTQGYPLEMHKVFTRWFKWGFYAHIIFSGVSLSILPIMIISRKAFQVLATITVTSFVISVLIWGYFGTLSRFNKGGQVASGDFLEQNEDEEVTDELWEQQLEASANAYGYQLKSGRFMMIYLILLYAVVGLSIIGFIIGTLVFCFCDPR